MSTDPYHAVQQDVQSSLQSAVTLRASYFRIQSMAREGSEELVWAQNELKATLAALEADLEALEESVRVVESTGPRFFNLGDAEVAERRKYVDRVRKEIEAMRAELEGNPRGERSDSPYGQEPPAGTSQSSLPLSHPLSPEQHQWEREEQQMLIQEQDRTMDSISGTLTNLAQQAGLMGQEIGQHVEMLEDLDRHVDSTDTKLNTAMRRLRRSVHETEDTKSGWCITFLIIVLIILLIAVIFA